MQHADIFKPFDRRADVGYFSETGKTIGRSARRTALSLRYICEIYFDKAFEATL